MEQIENEDGDDAPIPFTPVPLRQRHDGWTEERQRGFIAALKRIGSVSTAARQVGKTRRSAYKLRERPGAEDFAAAWDEAADFGRVNLHDHVIDRALNGAITPRFRLGRQTGVCFRYYDSIALAVLSGRTLNLDQRLKKAEEKGAREAFFGIERRWMEDVADKTEALNDYVNANNKLKKLVRLGVIGAEWLERDRPAASCFLPELVAAPVSPPAPRRREPRITLL